MSKTKMSKKGQTFGMDGLLGFGMMLVVLGIGLAVGLQILGDTKADMVANSSEANATQDTIEALAKIPTKLPLIVTVVMAAILIGILVVFLYNRRVR